jgi:hypothetical protein
MEIIMNMDLIDAAEIHDLDKARRAANLDRAALLKRKQAQRRSDRRIAAEYRDSRKSRRFGNLALAMAAE